MASDNDLLRRVFLTGKPHHPDFPATVDRVVAWLRARGSAILVDGQLSCCADEERANLAEVAWDLSLVIAMGGDGTILGTVRRMDACQVPILGVNLGGLGFLAETASGEVLDALADIARGEYQTDRRMMLDCRLLRDGESLGDFTVLNDVVINKGALARIIGLEARVDGRYLTLYRGDGLIVATPTGSTAYSLAAGGPIVYAEEDAVLLTPICPHILANRPILIPPGSTIEIIYQSGGGDVTLTLDGQVGHPLHPEDKVLIRRSDRRMRLIHRPDHDHYHILRRKLKWGEV
jgi:NAD+ kinase